MKKAGVIILFHLLLISGFGQLHSLSDQHIFNQLSINPAYAGSDDAFSALFTYRNQWVGFEGAPKTMTAAIHSPLGNELIGLGLIVTNDQIGVNNETNLMANYAYIIKMGDGKLSFGVGAGVTMLNADWDKLKSLSTNDTELLNASFRVANPNFSVGMYYRTPEFFLGVSLPMFLSYKYNPDTEKLTLKNDLSEYNLFITAGYIIELTRNVNLYPSTLTKFHAGNALQVDLYGQIIYKDTYWFGLGYRSIDTFVGMLQLQLTGQFRLAYSYDFDIGETGRYNSGSHEVMLKYVFSLRSKVEGPGRF